MGSPLSTTAPHTLILPSSPTLETPFISYHPEPRSGSHSAGKAAGAHEPRRLSREAGPVPSHGLPAPISGREGGTAGPEITQSKPSTLLVSPVRIKHPPSTPPPQTQAGLRKKERRARRGWGGGQGPAPRRMPLQVP